MYKAEVALWDKIIDEDINFYILLEHVFVVLEKIQGLPIDYSHYEKFLYKGISIKVPIEVYYKLCVSRFKQTSVEDEKYYFANCAMRAFNKTKFKHLRSKYSIEDFKKYSVKNYRAKYETLYGEEISSHMKNNLKIKMSSLSKDTIKSRNKSIQSAMIDCWHRRKTN